MRDIILSAAAPLLVAVEHACGVGQPLPLDEPWLEMEIDIERENEVPRLRISPQLSTGKVTAYQTLFRSIPPTRGIGVGTPDARFPASTEQEDVMPDSVYKVIELIGTSTDSWEKAAANAVEQAAKSLRDLRIAEVVKLDMQLDDKGKVEAYRAKLNVSFKFEGT
ncbi:dodecin family protein [Bradyrhizobium sp. LVM 105]|uniref:dodecin family protein n=1 Tax=Bradyrhizobium sp. LVM 105 TaxID=2341115 RepID=UPI0024BF3DA9|nr:dodecin family protein [Bradyrhizobium sp. LVM 105]